MTTVNHPAITELPPAATVKHITLDDGQQASVVIQGGRITKILAANGQVAELSWKDDATNSNNWQVKYHQSPPSQQAAWQDKGNEAFPSSAGSDSDKIMDTPVQQESPHSHARQYSAPPMQQPQMYAATPQKHSSLGPGSMSMAMRAEMPTILETNSQPAPEPRSMQYARPASQEGSQPAAWNPTNSWLPTSAPAINQPGSLTGHYSNDSIMGNASKQAQLRSAPSPSGRPHSQSVPHTYSSQHPPKVPSAYRASMNGQQRHSYGHSLPDEGGQQVPYAPETPDPLEQRQAGPTRAPAPSPSISSQQNRAAPSSPAAPAAAKKMTVWKKLKKALFTPGKSKREAAAQQLMQASADTPTSQRYSEKHTYQAEGAVNYSRKTSFQEARESVQPPGPYRQSLDSYRQRPNYRYSTESASYAHPPRRRQTFDLSGSQTNYRQYLDSNFYSHHQSFRQSADISPQYSTHRQSTESAQLAECPSYRQPMDPAQPDPYVTPPHYREGRPSLDGASPVRLLSYPPLQQVERSRSASNTDMGTRRAFAANLQMVEPYSNEVHRPNYTQSYAAPDHPNRRTSLNTDFSFGMPEAGRNPGGLRPQASQERLQQQQYMRQHFIKQQQEERRRSAEQQQLQQQQQQARQQWGGVGGGGNSIHDSPPLRQHSSSSTTPDKAQHLHSAPTRAISLDGRSQEAGGGDDRRSRRIRTVDYSKPGSEAPFSVPSMSGMAGRWVKNLNQGIEGVEVDDLLQLSYLQRLARQKVAEMEIIETLEVFEVVWNIPLNNGHSKIKKTDKYLKNSEVCELPRRDGRQGVLRSQINFTPEGHVHIRALQGDPFGAVFHDRIKMSTGGHRLKIEQKFQLLAPGVMPVKHHSIWQRIEEPK